VHFALADTASQDVFHTSHSAGAAKGFGEALQWLRSLSRTSRVIEESGPDTIGPTDTPPFGEPALRELMSP
jgi:hypothetical protein